MGASTATTSRAADLLSFMLSSTVELSKAACDTIWHDHGTLQFQGQQHQQQYYLHADQLDSDLFQHCVQLLLARWLRQSSTLSIWPRELSQLISRFASRISFVIDRSRITQTTCSSACWQLPALNCLSVNQADGDGDGDGDSDETILHKCRLTVPCSPLIQLNNDSATTTTSNWLLSTGKNSTNMLIAQRSVQFRFVIEQCDALECAKQARRPYHCRLSLGFDQCKEQGSLAHLYSYARVAVVFQSQSRSRARQRSVLQVMSSVGADLAVVLERERERKRGGQLVDCGREPWALGDSIGFRIVCAERVAYLYRNGRCLGPIYRFLSDCCYIRPSCYLITDGACRIRIDSNIL